MAEFKGPSQMELHMRTWLGFGVVVGGAGCVAILSIAIVAFAAEVDRSEMSRLAFTSVLPLFGTWVGTVLAFYFAKDNFQAATDSMARLTTTISSSTIVSEVMIRRSSIVSKDLTAGEDADNLPLFELYNTMQIAWHEAAANFNGQRGRQIHTA